MRLCLMEKRPGLTNIVSRAIPLSFQRTTVSKGLAEQVHANIWKAQRRKRILLKHNGDRSLRVCDEPQRYRLSTLRPCQIHHNWQRTSRRCIFSRDSLSQRSLPILWQGHQVTSLPLLLSKNSPSPRD